MPPRGGPEGSPPRQGAPNLLLSIVPRRYDTSHHAGGPTQSATGSSASSIRVGRESNSVWGESSGCSRTTNLFTSSTRLVSQQASPPAFVRIPAVRRSAAAAQGMPTTGAFLFRSGSGAGSVDSLPNPLLLPDNASPIFDKPSLSRHCAASASVFPHSRRPINLTWDAYDRHPAFLPFRCLRDGDVSIDTLLNTPLSVEHPLTFPAKPSPLRHCAASKDAVTQTVAAAHEMPMLASNQTTFKVTTKQPSKLQSNYHQMDIQVPHFATSITSAARGSIFAACAINYYFQHLEPCQGAQLVH